MCRDRSICMTEKPNILGGIRIEAQRKEEDIFLLPTETSMTDIRFPEIWEMMMVVFVTHQEYATKERKKGI